MTPKISFIVPVYNTASYLPKCLQSILDQSYKDIEIIVINDGSTDSSSEIINNFIKKDNRISVITNINSGISNARNTGIKYARGEYIVFVDSDDWLDINFLSVIYHNPKNYDLIACGYTREFIKLSLPRHFGLSGEFNAYKFKLLLIYPIIDNKIDPGSVDALTTVWGKLYKSEIIKKNNLWFTDLSIIGTAEDLLFNLLYTNHASTVLLIDKPLYHYRKYNSNSITTLYKPDLIIKWANLYDKLSDAIGNDKNLLSLIESRRAISTIGLGLNALNNPSSILEIYKSISEIIKSEKYNNAYNHLTLSQFKLQWKIFFLCAKYKFTLGVYILLLIIKSIINRGNT